MKTMLLAVAALLVVGCGGSEDVAAVQSPFESAPACERAPHFGFSTVECCEAGAVPAEGGGCGAYFVYCGATFGYRLVDGEWVPETEALNRCE